MSEEAPDDEDPMIEMTPQEDVYSYMMLIGPTESVKSGGKFNMDTAVGFFLVAVTLFIQGYLLWAVFNSVITGNMQWEKGIVNTGQGWDLLAEPEGPCNTGKSLCTIEKENNNKFTCAPPSVRLSGSWAILDTNGDGVWTREEVMASREELKCKYIVDPMEVFNVFVQFVVARDHIIWVHPDVRAAKAIPKPYFDYAGGDIIMCGYRNEAMCANLLKSGFFDAPLEFNTVPRVGNTIDSAMHYCRELLKPGGTCERTLPSTYSVWKVESDQECKTRKYTKFIYEHPTSGMKRSMLEVDYAARLQYEKVQTWLFKIYKTLIVMVWIMSMVLEFKKMVGIITWVINMNSDKAAVDEGKEPVELGSDDSYTIHGITSQHRLIQSVVTFVRLIMLSVLTWVGTSLLLASPEFMSLLFDAVSLKFIIELQEIFYAQILRQKVRDQTCSVNPMETKQFGLAGLNKNPGAKDFMWLFLSIGLAIGVMYNYYQISVIPLGEAIECTCLGQGEKCVEATAFTYDYWHHYWKTATPQIFKDVAVMKQQHEGGQLLQAANSTFRNVLAQRHALLKP